MTFLDLYSQVLIETKNGTADPTIVAIAKGFVNQAIFDLAEEKQIPELLRLEETLTPTPSAAQFLSTLTGPFLAVYQITYRVIDPAFPNAEPIAAWMLADRDGLISPAPIFGKPTNYKLGGSAGTFVTAPETPIIILDPYYSIDNVTDRIDFSYWQRPVTLVDDADASPAPQHAEEIIRRAVANFWLRDGQTERARMKRAETTTELNSASSPTKGQP